MKTTWKWISTLVTLSLTAQSAQTVLPVLAQDDLSGLKESEGSFLDEEEWTDDDPYWSVGDVHYFDDPSEDPDWTQEPALSDARTTAEDDQQTGISSAMEKDPYWAVGDVHYFEEPLAMKNGSDGSPNLKSSGSRPEEESRARPALGKQIPEDWNGGNDPSRSFVSVELSRLPAPAAASSEQTSKSLFQPHAQEEISVCDAIQDQGATVCSGDFLFTRSGDSGKITAVLNPVEGIVPEGSVWIESADQSVFQTSMDGRWKACRPGFAQFSIRYKYDEKTMEKLRKLGIDGDARQEAMLMIGVLVTEDMPTYSLYDPASGQFLITSSRREMNYLQKHGWRTVSNGWVLPETGGTPIHRFYNPESGDHRFTCDAALAGQLLKEGWIQEHSDLSSYQSDGVPVHELSRTIDGHRMHRYAVDQWELADATLKEGWKDEGVCFYAMPLDWPEGYTAPYRLAGS